jgi:hypothetical protein
MGREADGGVATDIRRADGNAAWPGLPNDLGQWIHGELERMNK